MKFKKVKKEDVLKALAIIIIPGSIPVYLGYKLYRYVKDKDERLKRENNDEHQSGSEKLP